MSGTLVRSNALLNPSTGRSVVVAFDHGSNGMVPGGEDSRAMIEQLARADVEGLLVGPGLMRHLAPRLAHPGAPRLIVAIDMGVFGLLPGEQAPLGAHRQLISPEEALRYGATAVKMLLPLGLGQQTPYSDSIAMIGRVAEECDRLGLPLMVEPAFWGAAIDDVTDEMIAHATRMSIELGASLLKIPAPREIDALREIVERTFLPVYLLGGVPTGASFGRAISAWMEAGATGVVIGRNVWSRPDVEVAIDGLRAGVHDLDPDRCERQLAAAEGKAVSA